MNDILKNTYRHVRRNFPKMTAKNAIFRARELIAAGRWETHFYASAPSAGEAFNAGGTRARFCDDYAGLGFRLVGFADEIAPRLIEHKGWFTRGNDWNETIRGAVFLVSGKDGHARAFPGYVESENPDAAVIACTWRDAEEISARDGELDLSEYRDVAITADRMAEISAEESRAYDQAWQAGSRHAQNMEEIAAARKYARKIASAARDNVRNNAVICATLRNKVQELRTKIRKLSSENEMLRAGEWYCRDDNLTFNDSDATMRDAFNDGAGSKVLA